MSAGAPFDIVGETAARRGGEAHTRAHRRILWQLRLTSLWAPLAIFGLLLVLYVVLTQFVPAAASWAQPVLQGLAGAMVLATLGLWLLRLALPRYGQLRHARVEGVELIAQLSRELAREESAGAREALLTAALRLDERWHERDPVAIVQAVNELGTLADTQIPGWRRRGTVHAGVGLVLTLLGVLLLRTFVVEPFRIPSGSMLPTLQIGDHVVVNRFIYGVRIPLVNEVPFVIVRRPGRGDVIVFVNPLDPSRDFIKRVVGVPGDRVEIVNAVVHINGQPQGQELVDPRYVVNDRHFAGFWTQSELELYEEDLSGARHAILLEPNHPHRRQTEGPWTVPEGHVFVLGDNRENSGDSRYGFAVPGHGITFVPYGYIKGKAMVVWLSLGHGGWLSGLFGGTGLRTDRLFEPIR